MKKLVVLAMLFVAVAAWAQFTAGVTLDYMWAQDFAAGKEFSDRPILELKFSWVADEFTSVYVELEEGPLNSQGDTGFSAVPVDTDGDGDIDSDDALILDAATGKPWDIGGYRMYGHTLSDKGYDVRIAGLDRANFTTDLGKALKLPVGVKVMYGLNEWNNADIIKVTKSEFEDYLGEADIRTWGAQVEVMPAPMVTLRSNWSWNGGVYSNNSMFLAGAYGTVAPVSYELTYFTHNQEAAKGWIEGGVKAAQDVAPGINVAAAFSFEYDMAELEDYQEQVVALSVFPGMATSLGAIPAYGYGAFGTDLEAAPDSAYLLQAGLQVMFQKMAALGVAWRGAEDMLGGAVQIQGYVMPPGMPLEILANLGLGLDSDVFESFDSVEVCARYTIGKALFFLGLYYQPEGGRGIAKEQADFDLAGVSANGGLETTAIFMRGKVAL